MKVKQVPAAPDLSADTIAVLLGGWSAHAPEPCAEPSFGGGFLELYDPGGIAELWKQHETWLRAKAATWGWRPQFEGRDGTLRYYAEYTAEFGEP